MLSVDRDIHGNAKFYLTSLCRQGQLRATDARIIGELKSKYILTPNTDIISNNAIKEKLIITTPNADYLPDVNLGTQIITFCEDGRWGAEDWGQWPQWYIQGQEHFAFIPRKPSPQEITDHPLRRLWWDMKKEHFATTGPNVGLLSSSIAQELYDIRTLLMKEVEACVCLNGADFQELQVAARGMRAFTSALVFTPQSLFNVMVTIAAAQRYCLATRALLDKIKKWDCSPVSDTIRPVDTTIMGCVTDCVPVVIELYEKGVPVWFVRPADKIPQDIVIVEQQDVRRPGEAGVVMRRWKGAPIFYSGPLSGQMHAAIEQWKPGSLNIFLVNASPACDELETGAERTDRAEKRTASRKTPYSKLGTEEKSTIKAQSPLTVNESLFRDLVSPYCSQPPSAWSAALQAVKRIRSRIIQHPDLLLFRGYPFPPLQVLCTGNKENSLDATLAWLVIRPIWMEKISQSDRTNLPSPQQWRMKLRDIALELELTRTNIKAPRPSQPLAPQSPTSSSSSAPQFSTASTQSKPNRSTRARQAAEDIFTIPIPSKQELMHIIWYDRAVWRRGNIDFPPHNRQLAAWDCQEHNFRLELVTLDRVLLSTIWSNEEGAAERNAKLDAMWPNSFLLMHDLPVLATGITAPNWVDRCEFTEAFRMVLLAWPGETPRRLANLIPHRVSPTTGRKEWNLKILDQVENEIAKYYCQMFFDYFGRAPSIPHVFPRS